MPKGLKRYYGRNDLHFLTFSCYRRLPLLGTVRARATCLRRPLEKCASATSFTWWDTW